MNLDFDRVTAVVDQENDRICLVTNHGRDFLSRQLKRPVANQGHDPPLGKPDGIAQRGTHRPADRTILQLNLKVSSRGEVELHAVEPGVTRLSDHGTLFIE